MSPASPANNNAIPHNGRRNARPDGSLEILKTLRDQVRVDLNLAGKEARDRWERIEERIRVARQRLRAGAGSRSVRPLVDSIKRFRRSLSPKERTR